MTHQKPSRQMIETESTPVETLLSHLSGRWTIHILWILDTHGALRFGELKRQVGGISAKVLTDRLRNLEAIGVIDRSYEPTVPPKVTYCISDRGQSLSQPLYALCDLASRWREENGQPQASND